jgi:CubicO group peptidase (beta-lactamase class C family)
MTPQLTKADLTAVGLSSSALNDVDRVISGFLKEEADDTGAFAGAVLLVSWRRQVIKHTAYGYAELFDEKLKRLKHPRPMCVDSVFDLASVTKVVATSMAVALLFDEGKLLLTDPISRFLPAFNWPSKRDITVFDLITHSSGLPNWLPFYLLVDTLEEAIDLIAELPLTFTRGHDRVYSDVNFVVLGKLIETVTDLPFADFVETQVFQFLGAVNTRFCPPESWRERIVATSIGNPFEAQMCSTRSFPILPPRSVEDLPSWRRHVLVGEVNDANCHLVFGGVSGHAGLFSTAWDIAVLAQTLLDGLATGRKHLLRAETITYFVTPKSHLGQGLGWRTGRLRDFPATFGHSGFVGNQVFIDPHNQLTILLFTNRVHSALPYVEPSSFIGPIVSSVYQGLGLSNGVEVDPWLAK